MSVRPKISVLINTCDEGHLIKECLESVSGWADEIVVCDMQSSDDSVAICKAFGATVWNHRRMLAPEPDARIFGIGKCSGDWILVLDPDMRVSPQLRRRLDEITSEDLADLVDLHCINYFFTRWCSHGHGSRPVFRKFFKRLRFLPDCRNIHTFWHDSLSGRVIVLSREHAITHYAYATVQDLVATLVRYARQEADDSFGRGRSFNVGMALWRPAKRFAGDYFFRRGFLDGVPGLVVSVAIAWYLFLIEAYLWELSRHNGLSRMTETTP
jgi:glycosyltransferase involved in cell wall biosynthesis